MKKTISLFLAALPLITSLGISASAAEPASGYLNIMTYNVSGIPVIGDSQGTQRELTGGDRMAKIGEALCSESGCDIIGTQEDFDNHDALAAAMPDYAYQTLSSGGIPLGDGLSVFSKYPIYNVARTGWEQNYGVLSGSSDRLTKKGIVSCVVEIADGLYIDLYVLHADAGKDIKSVEARKDNFRQLAAMINARTEDRAVIVFGDFNFTYSRNLADDMYETLVVPAGLTDCWVQLCNNGDCTYDGGVDWNPTQNEALDRIMYKSGGGITLNAESFEYRQFTNENNETYTDHIAAKARITYQVTGATTVPDTLNTQDPIDEEQRQSDLTQAVLDTLALIFSSLPELIYLIGQGIDLIP